MYDYDRRTASKRDDLQALADTLKKKGIETSGLGRHGAVFSCKSKREVTQVQDAAKQKGFEAEAHGLDVFVM